MTEGLDFGLYYVCDSLQVKYVCLGNMKQPVV